MDPILFATIELALFLGAISSAYWLWIRPNLYAAARKEAELIGKQALLQAREEAVRIREDAEAEIRQKQLNLTKQEERLQAREDAIASGKKALEEEAQDLSKRCHSLEAQEEGLLRQYEKVSQLGKEEARALMLSQVEKEAHEEVAKRSRAIEEAALNDVGKRVQKIVLEAMQRSSVDYVTEATLSVIQLPSEDMKGRIIGREGRNIRAFETATGVDVIIDDTPDTVVVSCFDPVRREVARLALERLISDGRIHPGRIEDVIKKAQADVDQQIQEAGEQAVYDVGVHGLHPELIKLVGRMRFRTSYGQNLLKHTKEVCWLAGIMAAELKLDVDLAKRGALLHDVGKVLTHESEGTHVQLGVEVARKYGEQAVVINCIEAHHDDVPHESPISVIVQAADAVSGSRPGGRREAFESYVKRLTKLEELANGFPGVEKTFAIQAGREIRVVVTPEKVDDARAGQLSDEIARKIENELQYPGQIKVVVVRETRAIEFAR